MLRDTQMLHPFFFASLLPFWRSRFFNVFLTIFIFPTSPQVRKLLSKEDTPPIEQVVADNLTPRLVELMRTSEDPRLILETAWAVTNIASGEDRFTKCVVQAGGVDAFLSILECFEYFVVLSTGL